MSKTPRKNSYEYRIAFGAWINDMRNGPLPLENWPASRVDDETVDSVIRAMDVQAEAGFNVLDVWGLFATSAYPPDIVSVLTRERRSKLKRLFAAAKERGICMMFGLGLFTWGFDEIIKRDPTVRGLDIAGVPSAHAMCGAREESWGYLQKIIDMALGEFDFCGVHLESADQGWCHCSECAGKYGVVGYNVRINKRAAQYIRSKWPDKVITSIPINWLAVANGRRHFTQEEKAEIIELSRHIDCFMDQGWRGTFIPASERKTFISQLHCDYGTSAGLWLYPSVRWDRCSYFLPYPKRTSQAIKEHFRDGARGCMFYQGPVVNPGTELTTAVGGRMLADTGLDIRDTIAEVIERYYKPKSAKALRTLAHIFERAEESYFGEWTEERFAEVQGTAMPGEFKLDELWGRSPGPATFLSNLYLCAYGRLAYKKGLVSILEELEQIEDACDDNGRLQRIKRAVMYTLTLINTIGLCLGERETFRDGVSAFKRTWL
jgi:hypothetical protein